MTNDRLEGNQRRIDQMLTMYSKLRDRYSFWALLLTLGILGSSVILCTCTFLPEEALRFVHLSVIGTRVVVGFFSGFVLFLSIVELRVDWREKSRLFSDGAERLARLKSRYKTALRDEKSPSSDEIASLVNEYNSIMALLPPVPDGQFLRLKAYHLRKVRLSQMMQDAVGCPVWLLRLWLFLEGIQHKRRAKKGEAP